HADVEINANQDRAVITRLRWEHSKGVATSPVAGHPPLVATHLLDGHPTVDGHFDVAGFSIEQMIHDMQLTYFGKVQWVVNASVDAHAELWRMADHPPENGRPAITMNVVADSHNFAVLKNYHQFGPQENIL